MGGVEGGDYGAGGGWVALFVEKLVSRIGQSALHFLKAISKRAMHKILERCAKDFERHHIFIAKRLLHCTNCLTLTLLACGPVELPSNTSKRLARKAKTRLAIMSAKFTPRQNREY